MKWEGKRKRLKTFPGFLLTGVWQNRMTLDADDFNWMTLLPCDTDAANYLLLFDRFIRVCCFVQSTTLETFRKAHYCNLILNFSSENCWKIKCFTVILTWLSLNRKNHNVFKIKIKFSKPTMEVVHSDETKEMICFYSVLTCPT